MRFFFYGTLRDADIRHLVIGRALPDTLVSSARLHGYTARRAHGGPYPILVRLGGGHTDGVVVDGLTRHEARRLDAYEGAGYRRMKLPILLADGQEIDALVYLPRPGLRAAAQRWDLRTWQRCEKQGYLRALGVSGHAARST